MLGELGDEAELAGEWRVVGGEEVAQQPLHPPSRQHQLGRPGERRGQLHHLHLHLHSSLTSSSGSCISLPPLMSTKIFRHLSRYLTPSFSSSATFATICLTCGGEVPDEVGPNENEDRLEGVLGGGEGGAPRRRWGGRGRRGDG